MANILEQMVIGAVSAGAIASALVGSHILLMRVFRRHDPPILASFGVAIFLLLFLAFVGAAIIDLWPAKQTAAQIQKQQEIQKFCDEQRKIGNIALTTCPR